MGPVRSTQPVHSPDHAVAVVRPTQPVHSTTSGWLSQPVRIRIPTQRLSREEVPLGTRALSLEDRMERNPTWCPTTFRDAATAHPSPSTRKQNEMPKLEDAFGFGLGWSSDGHGLSPNGPGSCGS